MIVGKKLALRGITLLGVLFSVLLLVVVTLGATGLSDNMLKAIVSDQLRELRTSLAQTIRDPLELEKVLEQRRNQLYDFYGLDEPWYNRLPDLIIRVLSLDLGSARNLKSFSGSSKVSDIVLERLPNTILLVTTALIISGLLGLYFGVKLAIKAGTKFDRFFSYLSSISYALPTWWLGIIFILLLAFQLRIFPPTGMYSSPPPSDNLLKFLDLLWHASLPILTLVVASIGGWIYSVRTMVLNVAQEDFVTLGRAKGLKESTIMKRYIIRVAAPPILTGLILGLAGSLGGAILTETVFGWPGMGRLYYDAILALDENVIIALTFLFTLIYIIARFILEALYMVLDPRVRY
ncbi:MAG: ABC transporter permease [Nitrososphaerales archaeon]